MRSSCLLLALALNFASGALENKGQMSYAACEEACEGKLPCLGTEESDKEIRDAVASLCELETIPDVQAGPLTQDAYAAWKATGCHRSAWIALTDRENEQSEGGEFKWLEGCVANLAVYENWLPGTVGKNNKKGGAKKWEGSPDEDSDCVGWIHGGWGDYYCSAPDSNCFCQEDVTTTTSVVVDEPCVASCCSRRNLRFGMDECAECTCP